MRRTIALAGAVLLLGARGYAIIDPNFTPRHLVEQADVIFAGRLSPDAGGDGWRVAVEMQIRGEVGKSQALSLAGCNKDHVEDIRKHLRSNQAGPVVVYSGTLKEQKRSYLHLGGQWLDVRSEGKDSWAVKGYAPGMSGTYAGGTDKLILMSRYLAYDPNAHVPVTAGIRWIENVKVADVPGAVAGLAAVELPPADKKGRQLVHLFVACDRGDRLYRPKEGAEALEDVTAAAGLQTRSRCFLWTDLNGDGLADLVSWDGTHVAAHLADATGRLAPAAKLKAKLEADCLALAACSAGGKPGVLISTQGTPLLWSADVQAGWKAAALPGGLENLGQASACVVGDLDGDGFADILQPCGGGAAFWKGAAGGFAKPVARKVATGGGLARVAVGDFDEDGSLDVFLSGPERNTLWENDGSGRFAEVFRFSGSLSYKCPPGAAGVEATDLNHDGRTDLCFIAETSDLRYHWNRGFRAFAEEGEVRLPGTETEPGRPPLGQRALAVGDFNRDGSLDLAVMVSNGQLRCYYNEQMDQPALRLRLPKGAAGPVTVSCWMGGKYPVCTGTAVVSGHSPATYVTARYRGKVIVRYVLPGKGKRELPVVVEEGARDVVLPMK